MLILAYHATLAQLVEQLIRNQQVGSSNLLGGSKKSRSIERDFSILKKFVQKPKPKLEANAKITKPMLETSIARPQTPKPYK